MKPGALRLGNRLGSCDAAKARNSPRWEHEVLPTFGSRPNRCLHQCMPPDVLFTPAMPDTPRRPNVPRLVDRLDPYGDTREQLKLVSVAASPLATPLLRALGVSDDVIAALRDAAGVARDLERVDETARILAEHDWPFFEFAPAEASHRAALLFAEGRIEEADALLIEAWENNDLALFRMARQRIFHLYWSGDEDDLPSEIGQSRATLIDDAIEFHRLGKYSGSVLVLLSQIDGIVADWSDDGRHLFRRNRDGTPAARVVDGVTMAGHPEVLLAISERLTSRFDETDVTSTLNRHGIVHGRGLGYNTRSNSTKLFAALFVVATWAQPKARERLGREAEDRETRYAGSKERDESLRRLDRRGFSQAKEALYSVALVQHNFWERERRYSRIVAELDSAGLFFKEALPEISISPEGDTWWAWLHTTAGYVLGIGGRSGERSLWHFGSDDPPSSGPPTAGWHEDGTAQGHPDW